MTIQEAKAGIKCEQRFIKRLGKHTAKVIGELSVSNQQVVNRLVDKYTNDPRSEGAILRSMSKVDGLRNPIARKTAKLPVPETQHGIALMVMALAGYIAAAEETREEWECALASLEQEAEQSKIEKGGKP